MTLSFKINGVAKDAYEFTVEEQKNGVLTITVPTTVSVSVGDTVEVLTDSTTILKGEVRRIQKIRQAKTRPDKKILTCMNYTHLLYEKHCLDYGYHEYIDKDAGWIANDLVDHYFSGVLTSVHVDTTTGVTIIRVDFDGKTVGAALEELARRADCGFYVDKDKDVHFFVAGAESSGVTIQDLRDIEVVDESLRKTVKVVVRGRHRALQASSGSGYPEKYYQDNRITSVAEAQEVADALQSKWGSDLQQVEVVKDEFLGVHVGLTAVLNSPDDGFNSETLEVQSVVWRFRPPERCVTTVVLGDEEPSIDSVLAGLARGVNYEPETNLDQIDDGTSWKKIASSHWLSGGKPYIKEAAQFLDKVVEAGKLATDAVMFNVSKFAQVLHMTLDKLGSTTVYDYSEEENHGTVSGATLVDGMFGKCLSFDGLYDYVDLGTDDSLLPSLPITLEAWAYIDPADEGESWGRIINLEGDSGGFSIWYNSASNNITGRVTLTTGGDKYASFVISSAGWYHITATASATALTLYINGEQKDQATYASDTINYGANKHGYLGGKGTGYNFKGKIDEPRVYGLILTADEVKASYRLGAITSMPTLITDKMISSEQIIGKKFVTSKDVGEAGGPAGIRFDAAEIAGYSGGTTKQFYLQASDGKAMAGGGDVELGADGIKIKGEKIRFYFDDALVGSVDPKGAGIQIQSPSGKNIYLAPSMGDYLADVIVAGHVNCYKLLGILTTGDNDAINYNVTRYFSFAISNYQTGTEDYAEMSMPKAGALKNMRVIVRSNSLVDAGCYITIRKNNTNTALQVYYSAGETGEKADTDEVDFVAGDEICVRIMPDTPTSGGIIVQSVVVEVY